MFATQKVRQPRVTEMTRKEQYARRCPRDCKCICHDFGGGPPHPGKKCRELSEDEKE